MRIGRVRRRIRRADRASGRPGARRHAPRDDRRRASAGATVASRSSAATSPGRPSERSPARARRHRAGGRARGARRRDVGAIRFDPPLPASIARAIEPHRDGLRCKSSCSRFKRAFWRDEKTRASTRRAESRRAVRSSVARSTAFPVWWTSYPSTRRSSSRGSAVRRPASCRGCRSKSSRRRAISSLATILEMKTATMRRELVATFHHDWINDPFSRGVVLVLACRRRARVRDAQPSRAQHDLVRRRSR